MQELGSVTDQIIYSGHGVSESAGPYFCLRVCKKKLLFWRQIEDLKKINKSPLQKTKQTPEQQKWQLGG